MFSDTVSVREATLLLVEGVSQLPLVRGRFLDTETNADLDAEPEYCGACLVSSMAIGAGCTPKEVNKALPAIAVSARSYEPLAALFASHGVHLPSDVIMRLVHAFDSRTSVLQLHYTDMYSSETQEQLKLKALEILFDYLRHE